MTPTTLAEYARQQYNSVGDDFFSDTELYRHIWSAQNELAREALLIEQTYSTTGVVSQQEYDYPTNTIAIKRITYNGLKLEPITFREDDAFTNGSAATTQTGTPLFYMVFNEVIYLRPIPDTAYTLKIFSFNEASEITSASSTIDVPTFFHQQIADYLLWRMAAKDQNYTAAQYYEQRWADNVKKAKIWKKKRLRADGFSNVQDVYTLPTSYFGVM